MFIQDLYYRTSELVSRLMYFLFCINPTFSLFIELLFLIFMNLSLPFQHFKDIMQIRRTDGEFLRKQLPKGGAKSRDGDDADKDGGDDENDAALVINREKCIPVVRGLMSLILSMDFTCNVDLFLVACKVQRNSTSKLAVTFYKKRFYSVSTMIFLSLKFVPNIEMVYLSPDI